MTNGAGQQKLTENNTQTIIDPMYNYPLNPTGSELTAPEPQQITPFDAPSALDAPAAHLAALPPESVAPAQTDALPESKDKRLHKINVPTDQIKDLLTEASAKVGEGCSPGEINFLVRMIAPSEDDAGDPGFHRLSVALRAHGPYLKKFGPKRLLQLPPNARLQPSESSYERLLAASPTSIDHVMSVDSSYFRHIMFPDLDELTCQGPGPKTMSTDFNWSHADGTSPGLIVPAYMTAFTGMTAGGPDGTRERKRSCRCNENTGAPRYVVHCGLGLSREDQANQIIRLALQAQLVLVVLTADGYLNAWYSVIGWSKSDVETFRSLACRFGSWFKTKIACHPYPFPGGVEEPFGYDDGDDCDDELVIENMGRVHRAIYFAPNVIGTKVNLKN